uniref:Uncharacterized protein n=1 Tax=Panagrolaimus sp. PS1159 TaxID=55785 RepID=A0AC35EY42_9BILA
MVLIFGIAPELHDAEIYISETKKHVEDFWIHKVSCNDEIENMYAHLKSSVTKPFSNDSNLGTICICIGDLKYVSYNYNNNIRKKLIENGLAAGFKAVEIIDTCTAMFFDAMR